MDHDDGDTEAAPPGAPGGAAEASEPPNTGEPSLLAELSSIDAPVTAGVETADGDHEGDEGDEGDEGPRRRVGLVTKVVVLAAVWILLVVFLIGRFHTDNSPPADARLGQAVGGAQSDGADAAGGGSDDGGAVEAGDPSAPGTGAVGPDGVAVATADGGSVLAGTAGGGAGATGAGGGAEGATSGEARPGTLPGGSTTTVKDGTTATTQGGGATTTTTDPGQPTTTVAPPPQAITVDIVTGPAFATPDGTVVATGGRVTFTNTSGAKVYLSADGGFQQPLDDGKSLSYDIAGTTTFRLYSKSHTFKATLTVQTA